VTQTAVRDELAYTSNKADTIDRVPEPEGIDRLLGLLAQLLTRMRVIVVPEEECRRLVGQVALDGMHPPRGKILQVLVDSYGSMSKTVVAARCTQPETSVGRYLQDLRAHGVINLLDFGPERWKLSAWTKERCRAF
jgi:hypothetical protein